MSRALAGAGEGIPHLEETLTQLFYLHPGAGGAEDPHSSLQALSNALIFPLTLGYKQHG